MSQSASYVNWATPGRQQQAAVNPKYRAAITVAEAGQLYTRQVIARVWKRIIFRLRNLNAMLCDTVLSGLAIVKNKP